MGKTYEKADQSLRDIVNRLIGTVECHKWINDIGLNLDLIWAYGARDDDGELVGDAITKNGIKALGLCRILPLKDRAMGRGDAEILVDKDWFDSVDDEEREALVDHELTHLQLKKDTDDLGRPKLKIRHHDFDCGWFTAVAKRHGSHSIEQIQASSILDQAGQFYWPSLIEAQGKVTIKAGDKEVTMTQNRFGSIARDLTAKQP